MQTNYTPFESRALKNIEAIELLNDIKDRPLSQSELDVLNEYDGWGGLAALFDNNTKHKVLSDRLRDAVEEKVFAELRQSILSSYFTPNYVSEIMWFILSKLGFTGGNVIEPSAGDGALIQGCPDSTRANSTFTAVEYCPISAGILAAKEPSIKVINNGFQSVALPYNYYDCGIANPPFLETFLQDDYDRKLKGSEHNFFLTKTLKTIREGGFLCAIVTRSFLDSVDNTTRTEIAKIATLKIAFRLPNDVFGNDNTNVITDILVFQRVKDGECDTNWLNVDTFEATVEGNASINNYYIEHPTHILGSPQVTTDRFNKLIVDVKREPNIEIQEKIVELCSGLTDCYVDISPGSVNKGEQDIEVSDDIALFNLGFDVKGKPVKRILDFETTPQYERMSFNSTQIKRLQKLITIKTILLSLLEAEANDTDDTACEHLRKQLNIHYDKFIKLYGAISGRGNGFMRECASFGALLGLEVDYEEGVSERVALKQSISPVEPSWQKAQIFSERLNSPVENKPQVETPADALIASLKFKGEVNLPYMTEISGLPESQLLQSLTGAIFFNPISKAYEYKDLYLSGNVIKKIKDAEANLSEYPQLQGNINALKEIAPEKLNAGEITVAFGAPWLPDEYLKDFIHHLLQIKNDYLEQATTSYVAGRWVTNIESYHVDWSRNTTTYGNHRVNAIDIIKKLLNFSPLKVVDRNSNGKPIINKTETELLQNNADRIKEEWGKWTFNCAVRKETLTELYNQQFNAFVEPVFDGSILTDDEGYLPGQNRTIKARPHQLSCIMRGVMTKSLLCDASVGAGKTLISLSLISMLYQLQKQNVGQKFKAMIVVPNHLINNWINEINKFYPSLASKVLIGTEYMTSKKQREAFLANIAFGDWPIVLITRSTFGLIPCSDDYTTGFIQDYIEEVEEHIKSTDDKLTLRELEKVKRSLNAKMLSVLNRQKKDKTNFCFEKLGIQQIVVDEIHEGGFKNLMYLSKLNGVGGLGPADGSQAAFDLFLKARHLQNKYDGRGLLGLSGTTITNSVVEAYTYLRYFYLDEAKKAGISDLDTFVSLFAQPTTEFELSITGSYKERTRLRSFTNLPELSAFFTQFSYVVTKDDLKSQCKAQGVPWYEPEITGGKPQLIMCPRSPNQSAYMAQILARAENIGNVDPSVDNMLKITSDAAKASLDMRFIDPSFEVEENSKINIAAAITARDYALSHDVKGVSLVYIDLGVPGGASGLNLYEEFKQKLIQYGVLEKHIVFAHDANTLQRKRQMETQLNNGDKRVFVSSTSKGSSGYNIQSRIIAVHNLDQSMSWTPSGIEQRLGRALRSGSLLLAQTREKGLPDHTINVYNYATDQSLDSFRFGLLETKARFISMLKNAQKHQRVLTEEEAGEASEDTFASIKAAISGNPLILAAVSTDKKIKQLESKRRAHQHEVMDAQYFVSKHANFKKERQETLSLVALDINNATQHENTFSFTTCNGKLTASATPHETLEERLKLAESAKDKTLKDYKAQYQALEEELKALLNEGEDKSSLTVKRLEASMDDVTSAYRNEKTRRVRRPRCDLEMLFEKELHLARNINGMSLYGSKSQFGTYRGFVVSIGMDFKKHYIYLEGEYFQRRLKFDSKKSVSTAKVLAILDEMFDEIWQEENRVNLHYEGIAKSYAVYEQRQHAQFKHESELLELEELQHAIHIALSSNNEVDPKFAHLLPKQTFEKVEPTYVSDIVLPEQVSPPECYLPDIEAGTSHIPTTITAPTVVGNFFEQTASLNSLFDEDDQLDELIEEHGLIF